VRGLSGEVNLETTSSQLGSKSDGKEERGD